MNTEWSSKMVWELDFCVFSEGKNLHLKDLKQGIIVHYLYEVLAGARKNESSR
jgi:hypothetical protein